MRITGGSLRGRTVPGRLPDGVRPTPSRVREALFSMLGQDLSGVTVLDAFAGSGILSFEALSRGADHVTQLDQNGRVLQHLRQANQALGVQDRVTLARAKVPAQLPSGHWDLALLDPPYAMDPEPTLLALLGRVGWRVVLECSSTRVVAVPEGLQLEDRRAYGDSALWVLSAVASAVTLP